MRKNAQGCDLYGPRHKTQVQRQGRREPLPPSGQLQVSQARPETSSQDENASISLRLPSLPELLTRLHGKERCDCRHRLAVPTVGDEKHGRLEMVCCVSKHKVREVKCITILLATLKSSCSGVSYSRYNQFYILILCV